VSIAPLSYISIEMNGNNQAFIIYLTHFFFTLLVCNFFLLKKYLTSDKHHRSHFSLKQCRHSNNLLYQSTASTQSLVVPKVSCDINEAKLLEYLRHSYVGVENVSRLYDRDGEPISAIRVDFKSSAVVMNILKENRVRVVRNHFDKLHFMPQTFFTFVVFLKLCCI
jgi:hypothetical protein